MVKYLLFEKLLRRNKSDIQYAFRTEGKRDCSIPELAVLGDFVLEQLYEILVALYAIRKSENRIIENEESEEYSEISDLQQLTDFTEQYHQILASKLEDTSPIILESKSILISK